MFVYIRSAAFIIVVTLKLVLQQSKNVTAKCTETLLPPPCIQFSLVFTQYSLQSYPGGITLIEGSSIYPQIKKSPHLISRLRVQFKINLYISLDLIELFKT